MEKKEWSKDVILANNLKNQKTCFFNINFPNHIMSATKSGSKLILRNQGGLFNLKDGKINKDESNKLNGAIIFNIDHSHQESIFDINHINSLLSGLAVEKIPQTEVHFLKNFTKKNKIGFIHKKPQKRGNCVFLHTYSGLFESACLFAAIDHKELVTKSFKIIL